ncbi:MAG: GntR family transcriptional regulator [Sedimentitalea sp.]
MTLVRAKPDIETLIAEEFARLVAQSGITKRSAVRLAVAGVITEGLLSPGELVPPETRLVKILGISLGTVQAAMQELQQYDVIVRRRGDGTRVASSEAYSSDVWHFRFSDKKTGDRMKITRSEVEIERTQSNGPWCKHFENDHLFLRILRRIKMDGSVRVGAEMVLPYRIAPELSDVSPAELKMVNIRRLLSERFNVHTSRATQHLETMMPNAIESTQFDLDPTALAFQISAVAYAPSARPIYYQRVIAPCDRCSFSF